MPSKKGSLLIPLSHRRCSSPSRTFCAMSVMALAGVCSPGTCPLGWSLPCYGALRAPRPCPHVLPPTHPPPALLSPCVFFPFQCSPHIPYECPWGIALVSPHPCPAVQAMVHELSQGKARKCRSIRESTHGAQGPVRDKMPNSL